MGKKKPAAPLTNSSIQSEKGSLPAKPQAQPILTNEQIGQVSGKIWQQLEDQGEQSIASLKSSMDVPADLVVAAIGWLAREDKLIFSTSGRSVLVSLR